MARFGEPHELVGATLLLLFRQAGSFMTGAEIYFEGGFTGMRFRVPGFSRSVSAGYWNPVDRQEFESPPAEPSSQAHLQLEETRDKVR